MPTQNITVGNSIWKNLVAELDLKIGKGYILQNVSLVNGLYTEQIVDPDGGEDPQHVISPRIIKNIVPSDDYGIWVRSEDKSSTVIFSVTPDSTIIVTENNGSAPSTDIDSNDRHSLNTVFGEKIIGIRRSDIAAQFQYGFSANSVSPEIENGGTIAIIESMLTVSTGTDISGSATIANRKALRYLPGQEAFSNFTAVFTTPKDNSYQRAGLFDNDNGFFIGYEGTDFKVTRRRGGIDTSVTIDVTTIFDSTIGIYDPTKGNVYKISFGYLGFASIAFEIMTPQGGWVILHRIEYPNSNTGVHILNTNLTPKILIANTGNNTNLSLGVGSFSTGVVGGSDADPTSRLFTFGKVEQATTAETLMVVTFRSKPIFNSITNYITSLFTLLSFNTDLSKSSLWELEINADITGTPTWEDINTFDSTIEYSIDAIVTKNTGILNFSMPLGKIDRELITDFEKQEIELLPTDYITLFIITPLGTNGTFDYSFRWKELF